MAAVSALGRTVCVLIRRLNSSCRRSMAFVTGMRGEWKISGLLGRHRESLEPPVQHCCANCRNPECSPQLRHDRLPGRPRIRTPANGGSDERCRSERSFAERLASMASGKSFRPSTTAIRMSPTPRFLSSFITLSQNFAPSVFSIHKPSTSLVPSAATPSAI